MSLLGGVLIKFCGNSWKHGNPGDFFGFEIFDFGIVLGRLILAGTSLGKLDLSRDFGRYSKLMFLFFMLYHSQWLFVSIHRCVFATHVGLTLFLKFLVTDKFP